jgi:hypothetical protein
MFTPYPMPDSVIKKVEIFGAGKQDDFDFVDRNGTLFEWNNNADTLKGKDLVEEDILFYPSITAEFPGMALTSHITPIKEELNPTAALWMSLPSTPILGWLKLQERMHVQYPPTQTRLMTFATMTTTI